MRHFLAIFGLFLLALIIAVFLPGLYGEYLWLDDKAILNAAIQQEGHVPGMYYLPLTVVSFAAEKAALGRFDPFISHAVNLGLHIINSVMVFWLGRLIRLNKIASGIASLIFIFHPAHAIAVSWVSCRKDVLYSVFYLLALVSYVKYLSSGNRWFWFGVLGCGILSVFSKPMALSLPIVLLLIDWYLKKPLKIIEKIPIAVCVWMIAAISWIIHAGVMAWDFPEGLLTFIWCGAFYVARFFFPFKSFALNYDLAAMISLILAAGILICLLCRTRLGVFAVSCMAVSTVFLWRGLYLAEDMVDDRFFYLGCLGFCFVAGQFLADKKFLMTLVLVALCIKTVSIIPFTANDDIFLWYRLAKNPHSHYLRYKLMENLYNSGRYIEAIRLGREIEDQIASRRFARFRRNKEVIAYLFYVHYGIGKCWEKLGYTDMARGKYAQIDERGWRIMEKIGP